MMHAYSFWKFDNYVCRAILSVTSGSVMVVLRNSMNEEYYSVGLMEKTPSRVFLLSTAWDYYGFKLLSPNMVFVLFFSLG